MDLIATNPPFSLFSKSFFPWVLDSGKGFILLCPKMVCSLKCVYGAWSNQKAWHGADMRGNRVFDRPDGTQYP